MYTYMINQIKANTVKRTESNPKPYIAFTDHVVAPDNVKRLLLWYIMKREEIQMEMENALYNDYQTAVIISTNVSLQRKILIIREVKKVFNLLIIYLYTVV